MLPVVAPIGGTSATSLRPRDLAAGSAEHLKCAAPRVLAPAAAAAVLASRGFVRRRNFRRPTRRRAWFGKSNQEKFESYVEQCSSYTARDLACLKPRWRTLLTGIQAGLEMPALVEAVKILYDDILPLRLGADLVSRQLNRAVTEARDRIRSDIPDGDVVAHRQLFDSMDFDKTGTLKKWEVEKITSHVGLLSETGQEAHDSITDRLIQLLTDLGHEGTKQIEFPDFLEGASRLLCIDSDSEPLSADQTRRIVTDLLPEDDGELHLQTSQYDKRFDEIVKFILDWEAEGTPLTENGRLGKVLEGSFAAAKNQEVLDALRFVYNDIAPFRIAGELIFGIVSRFLRAPTTA